MIEIVRQHVIPATYTLLPAAMASDEATAMLLAIGYQESRFEHRRQVGGPARGFLQFEQAGGVNGVMAHPRTREHLRDALIALRYPSTATPFAVYDAIAHNDVLAMVLGRLLLWTLPWPLPRRDDPNEGWKQYVAAWRPGKPHAHTWSEAWRIAWSLV